MPEDCGEVESVSDAIAIAPTLTVTAIDRQDETMTVAIGGSHGAGVLYMVGGPTDAGQSVSGWTETCFIGKVAVDTTSVTATVPTAWWSDAWHVRFVWRSAEDFPYDREVEWLHSAGKAWANSGIVPTLDTTVAVRGKCGADVCLFGLSKYLYIFEFKALHFQWLRTNPLVCLRVNGNPCACTHRGWEPTAVRMNEPLLCSRQLFTKGLLKSWIFLQIPFGRHTNSAGHCRESWIESGVGIYIRGFVP